MFVGIFGWGATASVSQALAPGRRAFLGSPWSPASTLQTIAADVFGAAGELLPVTRAEAMTVPAVVDARNIVVLSLAQGVLKTYRGDAEVASPAWCFRTDSQIPPSLRTLWTFDDLFFSGYSLWEVARSKAGAIGDAVRVPPERWSWDADMRVLVDDDPVQAADVVLFVGWDEGLLTTGASYIRGARELHRAVRGRVRTPVPHTTLQGTDPNMDLTEDEAKRLVEDYAASRRQPDGAVSYLPSSVKKEDSNGVEIALYEQGRNAEVLDFARLTGVPAAMLEASQVSASLTYETREGSRSILNERLRGRAGVFEARLSMDDVTPRGTRIALDLSHLQPDATGLPAPTED